MTYELIKVFGLQRSGNHAIINWLLGLDTQHTLFFNNQKKGKPLGGGGISLPEEVKANAKRNNGKVNHYPELIESFHEWGKTLVVSFENFDIQQYDERLADTPIEQLFGPPSASTIVIILRNPFCVAASLARMYPSTKSGSLRKKFRKIRNDPSAVLRTAKLWSKRTFNFGKTKQTGGHVKDKASAILELWPAYAELTQQHQLGKARIVPIVYDFWRADSAYRDDLAGMFGQANHDKFLDFVSDAGGGSSFSGIKVSARKIRLHSCIQRWEETPERRHLRSAFTRDPSFLQLTRKIFGESEVPSEFKFAKEIKSNNASSSSS